MSSQRVSCFAETWKTLKSIPKIGRTVGFCVLVVCFAACVTTVVAIFNVYMALIVTYPLNGIVIGLTMRYAAMTALEEPVEHEVFSCKKVLLYLKDGLSSPGAALGAVCICGLVFFTTIESIFIFLDHKLSVVVFAVIIVLVVILTLISPFVSTYVAIKRRGIRKFKISELLSYLHRPNTGILGIVGMQLLTLFLIIAITSVYLNFYFDVTFRPFYFEQAQRIQCIFHKSISEHVLIGRVALQTIGWILLATCFATVTGTLSLIIFILVSAHWFRQFNPREWIISGEHHSYPATGYQHRL